MEVIAIIQAKNKTSGAKNTEFRLFIGLLNNGEINEPKVAILYLDRIMKETFNCSALDNIIL